jgi:predicted MFS family arabinose efflux permease
MMAGITVGPLLGSVLYDVGGFRLPFLAVALLLAGVLVAAAVTVPVAADPPDITGAPGVGSRRFAGVPFPLLVVVVLLGAAAQFPNGLYDALWSRLLTDRGASALLIGLSLTLFGAPFVVLAPLGGRLAERRGPLLSAAIALIVADGFMASYGFVPSPVVITLLGVGEACVQSVAIPGGYALVARIFPQGRAATGQGWFGGAGTAAAGVAAVTGAPLYALVGSGAVFAGGAVLSATLAVSAVAVGRRRVDGD